MFSQFISLILLGLAAFAAAQNPTGAQLLRAKSNVTSLAYNGFYLAQYHQGAGFADATLVSNVSQALGGAFLNSTNVPMGQYYLDFNTTISAGGSENETLYYHAQVISEGGYNSMNLLTINLAEAPTGQFSFDDQGRLAWENSTGWAACEWIHAPGYPSVYWLDPYYVGITPLPCGCVPIELVQADQFT